MLKKLILIILLIIAGAYGAFMLWIKATHVEWGHNFTFKNELGIEVDSLDIFIGSTKTLLVASSDSTKYIEGNLNVPENGYPHEVEILIYSGSRRLKLKADSFNCYNCDVNHLYILRESGAEYQFLNL